jgi:DNA-binding MarR family transcriptional regulator
MYTSKLARALERGGLVARTDNPDDPRAVQLTFTERGAEVVVGAMAIVRELQEHMLAPLGGSQSAQSIALREALQALLKSPSLEEPLEE